MSATSLVLWALASIQLSLSSRLPQGKLEKSGLFYIPSNLIWDPTSGVVYCIQKCVCVLYARHVPAAPKLSFISNIGLAKNT